MEQDFLKYNFNDEFNFTLNSHEFLSIIGNNNDLIVHTFLHFNKKANILLYEREFNNKNLLYYRRNISFVLYKHLDIFTGETVADEIAFGLESLAMKKDEIRNLLESESRHFKIFDLLQRDPNSLGSSDKVKMKILSALIVKPNILIIDNVLDELDYEDKILVFKLLKEYVKNGLCVVNFTNDIEQTLNGDKIIVIYDKKVMCEGKTLSVLNEEKLLKRLGLWTPFIIEINNYFMDYNLISKYYLTNSKLVDALWK